MKGFAGFPDGKQQQVPLPALFFSDLLLSCDHVGELKVTLYIFWLVSRKRGERRYVSYKELAADARLLAGLAVPTMSPEESLRDALERAVVRGTLLRAALNRPSDPDAWYFVNSERGRQAVDDLVAGRWLPAGGEELCLEIHRPNIFVLYEQNIGPLVPLLTEELLEAETTYPASWIADAFREAVKANVRKWQYVHAILKRWAAEGRTDETPHRSEEGDWRRFLEGEYADYVER